MSIQRRRADLLRRLGRDADGAYARAIELAGNGAERAQLRRQRDRRAGGGLPD